MRDEWGKGCEIRDQSLILKENLNHLSSFCLSETFSILA
jgi:hypothetical protein